MKLILAVLGTLFFCDGSPGRSKVDSPEKRHPGLICVGWLSSTPRSRGRAEPQGTYVRTGDGGVTWKWGTVPGAMLDLDFRDVQAADERRAFLLSIGAGRNLTSTRRPMAARPGSSGSSTMIPVVFSMPLPFGMPIMGLQWATRWTDGLRF